jgi:hypothetical protein
MRSIISIDSASILPRSRASCVTFIISLSVGVEPEPIPRMKRPLLRWSNCAASAAIIAGWWSGALMTPVPKMSRSVRGTRLAASISGDG